MQQYIQQLVHRLAALKICYLLTHQAITEVLTAGCPDVCPFVNAIYVISLFLDRRRHCSLYVAQIAKHHMCHFCK